MRARRMIVVGFVAATIASFSPARAAAFDALSGVGAVTYRQECPDAFKIPVAARTADGRTWTFSIAGLHASCVVTWGSPISFEGRWEPRGAWECDADTGAGCPQSTDPARPGFFALGAVPSPQALTMTSLRFCVRAACFEGTALVERG